MESIDGTSQGPSRLPSSKVAPGFPHDLMQTQEGERGTMKAAISPTLRAVTLLAAGVLLGLPPAAADQPADTQRHGPARCGKARALAQRYLDEQTRQQIEDEYETMVRSGTREAMEDTDVLHCDLELEILPSEYDNMDGVCTMTIQSKSNSLTQFTFRLRSQYNIDAAYVNGSTPVSVSTPSSTTHVATLDRTYTMDETFTLTIEYSGHAESRGFGSIEFTTHDSTDIVYTLSEAYFAYTWWPCKDGDYGLPGDNSDKFTLDLAVIAPDDMVTASNGLLQGIDTLSGDRARYRWASDYPITTYLVCFSSTNYNTWSQTYTPIAGGSMPVWFYIYPEDDNSTNRAAWEKVVQMLSTLSDLYGEYPFVDEKYGIYECEFGGGMEHQTFTAQGTFAESVTVHELSHQWWGDMITCKTWNHIWLNEGFATYTEALWEEFKPGSTGLPALKADMATKKYTGGGSVYVSDAECASMWDIFSSNTSYDKGGWVLHMLRHVLGSDNFFDALAAYRTAYEYSATTTEDFQAVCEVFYGDSLDWFFQEWIYGEYCPAYAFGWSNTQVAGQDYLLLYLNQTQSGAYQRFNMPLDVDVDGTVHVIFNDADPEYFVIPLAAPATTVQLDPDEWVLWSSRSTTSYVAGPPKIVETLPAPGETLPAADSTGMVTVTFHTNVSTSAGHYALVGAAGGPVAVTFAYDSGTYTTTLTAAAELPPDTYTLTVSDALTAVDSGHQLDGEIADPMDPASLPSGEGVQGGSAEITFVVSFPLGDLNCDGTLNNFDIDPFVLALTDAPGYAAAYPECDVMLADMNEDGSVNNFDIDPFVALLTGG